MAGADTAARVGPIAERLLENQYAQENLREAVENLRGAYRRASKRRVKPAEDKKLRQQVREAAASLTEAAKALHSGRQKPKKRWGRRLLILLGLGAAGMAAALAASEDLRNKVLGESSVMRQSGDGASAAASPDRPVD
jgi:hypothetical protein